MWEQGQLLEKTSCKKARKAAAKGLEEALLLSPAAAVPSALVGCAAGRVRTVRGPGARTAPRPAAMADEDLGVGDGVESQFATYEDYLDSQISATDIYYLEDEDLARQLVELGYRGSGETLKREEFLARKKAAEQARMNKLRSTPKPLASASKDVTGYPFLASLAEREEMVRNGKLTTIIFIRDKNAKGQEVSGYIDYAHRLKTEALSPTSSARRS